MVEAKVTTSFVMAGAREVLTLPFPVCFNNDFIVNICKIADKGHIIAAIAQITDKHIRRCGGRF